MPEALTRRTFLAAGAGVVLAACGKGKSGPADQYAVVQAAPELLTGTDQRVSFAIFKGQRPLDHGSVRAAVTTDPTNPGPLQAAAIHKDIPGHPYFVIRHRFDKPSDKWFLVARVADQRVATQLENVVAPNQTKVPSPGQPMISVATPASANNQGVDPICTRQPACPFHDVSLDAAMSEDKPLAVLFATPALCESRTCGPVLDVLMSQSPAFSDRVRFIHVEIYTNLNEGKHVPAVDAYGLTFEPALFLAKRPPEGGTPVVQGRLDGPFDHVEARDALTRLVS